jgi:hypothetical protein
MALSDRDIIITPNRGASSEPIITLRGADAASSATMVMRVINSGTVSTLSFEGTAGQLFAVSDTFAGTIFSVNDISGIPSIEVIDNGDIKLAEWNGKVRVGGANNNENATSATTGELQVTGGVGVSRDVYVGGAMTVVGTLNAAVIAGSITNAANIGITDDPSNGATMYPTFVSATSGNQAIRVDSSGLVWIPSTNRLGIGTSSPSAPLHVYAATDPYIKVQTGGGSYSYIQLDDSSSNGYLIKNTSSGVSNGALAGALYTYTDNSKAFQHIHSGTPLFTILSTGRTGIGTTAPAGRLHVAGAGNAAGGNITIGEPSNNVAKWSYLVSTHYSAAQSQGFSLIGGYTDATSNRVVIGGSIYESNPATEIQFWTHTATTHSTGGSQRMVIDTNGNVGIGTTAPSTKLHILKAAPSGVAGVPTDTDLLIDSNTNSYLTFRQSADIGAYGGIQWVDNNVGAYITFRNFSGDVLTGSDSLIYGTYQDHIFQAGTSGAVNGKIEVARITQAGNMGIGKTAPTTRLHVYRDGLANNTVNPLITLDGKFNVTGVDSNDIVAIASRVENNGGGSQTTNIIGSGYQATYNTLLLQPSGGNVGVNNINPGRALDVTGVTNVSSHITQGALISRPNVSWGASGTSTGAVVIRFPGGSGNYGMVHIVIDIYTYDGENASTIIIGGHNWNGSWYNFGATRIGAFSKGVRVAFKDGQYAVVLGTNTSTWSYGQVVVRKIQNGSYYSGVMDLGGTYTIAQDAAAESYSYISGNLITTGSAGGGGWNSGNDGSGSGLDADLLDGLDSTAFLRRDVTNTMFAGQTSSLAFENQTSFFRFAFNELRFWDNQVGDIFGLDEHAYATTSMRAPIFYDRNDTTYYLDPASSGKALLVNGNIELTARSESWAEGIRINVPTAGTWGGIRINRSGASGPGNWAIGYTGLNSTNDLTFYSGTTNTIQVNLDHSANLSSIGSMRAPIFYDSANTAYYTDPASISSMYGVAIRGDTSSVDSANQIFFWDAGDTTTSAIGFKANGGEFTNPTGNGDGYNTYLTMDTVGRGWVFRRATGGTNFSSAFTSGWILNNGIWQANDSMRAPIFYDSNNTAFYTDPASTSVVNNLTVNGTLTYTGSIAAGVDFARRLDNHTRTAFTVGGNASTFYPVVFQLGSGATAQQYGEFMIERGGYDDPGFTGVNFSTMNARFSHKASGWGFGSTYENCEALYQNVQLIANWQQVIESSRMIIWLRGATIYHFYNIVGNTTLVNANAAGGNIVESNPAFYTYTFTPTTTINAKAQHSKYFNGGAFFDGNNRAFSLGVGTNASGTDGRLDVTADVRAPIYYDSNNTAFYTDPNSTTISLNMAGSVRAATHNRPGILSVASGTASTGASFAIQQETGEGWTGIFVDFEPNTGWGLYHDNPNNFFSFTAETATGSIRSFAVPSRSSGNRTAHEKFRVDQNNGDTITGGIGFAQSSFRAPIFFDNNDTTYFMDPATNSRFGGQVVIAGNASGSVGNRLIVGSTTVNFSLQDGNLRPTIHAHGQYPVLSLNHTVTSNTNHGPTVQFTCNGVGNQFVIGTDGAGTQLDMGYASAGDWNPHNGIAGYQGVTFFRATSSGLIGIGAQGDWGALGGGNPGYAIDTRGTLYNNSDIRAPIYYDANDTGYYMDPNSTAANCARFAGGIHVSIGNVTGSGIILADDGDIVDLNDGYCAMRFSFGMRVHSGNRSGGAVHTLHSDGNAYHDTSCRAPIFYDNNDTAYYVDPASLTRLNRLHINQRNDNYNVGSINPTNAVSDWQSLTNVDGQWTVSQFNATGSYTNSPPSVYTYGSVMSWRTANHSFQLYAAHTGDLSYKTQWNNDNYTGWLYPMVYGRTNGAGGAVYGSIFYDQNDTSFFADPASSSTFRQIRVAAQTQSASYNNAAIEVREFNYGGVQADITANWPRIGFHWGGRVASSIAMGSNGWIAIMNNPGTGYENLIAAQGLFTSEVTAYYSDIRLKTKVGSLDNAVEKVKAIETFKYVNNELANSFGFTDTDVHVGVSAQSVEAVLPEIVRHAPFDMKSQDGDTISASGEWYKTVQYDKLVPLLIEAIKEQQIIIEQHRAELDELRELKELVKKSLGK